MRYWWVLLFGLTCIYSCSTYTLPSSQSSHAELPSLEAPSAHTAVPRPAPSSTLAWPATTPPTVRAGTNDPAVTRPQPTRSSSSTPLLPSATPTTPAWQLPWLAWLGLTADGQPALIVTRLGDNNPRPVTLLNEPPDTRWWAGAVIRWSPDGNRILMAVAGKTTRSLDLVDVTSGARHTASQIAAASWVQEALWSPGGRWIAFQQSDESGYFSSTSIWVMPGAGGRPLKVTSEASGMAWSPDGTRLFFYKDRAWGYAPDSGIFSSSPPARYWRQPGEGIKLDLVNGDPSLARIACCAFLPALMSYVLKGEQAGPGQTLSGPGLAYYLLPSTGSAGQVLFTPPLDAQTELFDEASYYYLSPDGRRMAVTGPHEIFIISLESATLDSVVAGGFLGWSPDGTSWAAFTQPGGAGDRLEISLYSVLGDVRLTSYSQVVPGLGGNPGGGLQAGRLIDLFWPAVVHD